MRRENFKSLTVLLLVMIVTFGTHRNETVSQAIGKRLREYGIKTYRWAFPIFESPYKTWTHEKSETYTPIDYLLPEKIKTKYPEFSQLCIIETKTLSFPTTYKPFRIFYRLLEIPHDIEKKLLLFLHKGITDLHDGTASGKLNESRNYIMIAPDSRMLFEIELLIGRNVDEKDIDDICKELALSLKKPGDYLNNLEGFQEKINKKESDRP